MESQMKIADQSVIDDMLSKERFRLKHFENIIFNSVDFSNRVIDYVDIVTCSFRGCKFIHTDIVNTKINRSTFVDCNFSFARFSNTDLYKCDIACPTLSTAKILGHLHQCNLHPDFIASTCITPEGDIIGWKKCMGERIVKLLIPAGAKRSNALGRKCRAEYAQVLEIYEGGALLPAGCIAYSGWDGITMYKVDEVVRPTYFEPDRFQECAPGIHFYLTRHEAEQYVL